MTVFLDSYRILGLGVIGWSPLGSGVLTGKYGRADLANGAVSVGATRKDIALANGSLTERGLAMPKCWASIRRM